MDISAILYSILTKFCTLACYIPLILFGLIGLSLLVVFHEFGHFIFAKLFNVYVPSFSVGFGPRLYEKKIGETVFALSAIPMGGYVEIAGAQEVGQGEQLYAGRTDERSFNQKPYWQKMIILSAGIIFNAIFTYLVFSLLLYFGNPFIGVSNSDIPLIGHVIQGSLAERDGLRTGDLILEVDNQRVNTIAEFNQKIRDAGTFFVKIKILRDKEYKTISLALHEPIEIGEKFFEPKKVDEKKKPESQKVNEKKTPIIGILWSSKPLPFFQSLKEGFTQTWNIIIKIFSSFKNLKEVKEGIGGPLIIITYLTHFAGEGLKAFSYLLALISINLAIINVIPLPIFDGGQALFYTVEAILRRPLSDDIRLKIHYITWILLITLLVYLTYKDLSKIIYGNPKIFKS